MPSNDQILNGQQADGEFWLMCKKCGDNYHVSESFYNRNKNVRWRCKACIYMWL